MFGFLSKVHVCRMFDQLTFLISHLPQTNGVSELEFGLIYCLWVEISICICVIKGVMILVLTVYGMKILAIGVMVQLVIVRGIFSDLKQFVVIL